MSKNAWKNLAGQHLASFGPIVEQSNSEVDLWQELKELVANCGTNPDDIMQIKPIFDYAWWCVALSNDADLECTARTFFYEDIPAYSDTQNKLVPFLDLDKFRVLKDSLSARIDEEEFKQLFSQFEVAF